MFLTTTIYRVAFGSWSFKSIDSDGINANTERISFGFTLSEDWNIIDGQYPLLTRESCKYKILRLKSNELWLEHTDSIQNEYVIKFENNQQ